MIKKILALCFALLMLLTFIPGAFADDEDYTYQTTPMKYLKSYKEWEAIRDEYAPISGDLRQDILTVARSQIGNCASATKTQYVEGYGTKHWNLYGDFMGSSYCEWCDAFASFCVYYGGAGDYPLEISCMRHERILKKMGYWRNWNQYVPKPGDIVFLALSSEADSASHAAIVERVVAKKGDKKAYLVTIEGNVSVPNGNGCSGVARCVRSFDDVVGYGTYEVGEIFDDKLTIRPNENPGGEVNDAYTQTLVPVKDVLIFIGCENTPYYYYWFPEEKPIQITDSQEPVVEEVNPEDETPVEIPVLPSHNSVEENAPENPTYKKVEEQKEIKSGEQKVTELQIKFKSYLKSVID